MLRPLRPVPPRRLRETVDPTTGRRRPSRGVLISAEAQRSIRPEWIVPPSGADVDGEMLMDTRVALVTSRSDGGIEPGRIPAHGQGNSGPRSQRRRVVSVSRLGCVPRGETDAQPDHF